MKSFSQFLQEAYLIEEIPANMSRDQFNRLPAETRRRLSGSESGIGKKGQTLTPEQTPLAVRGARSTKNAPPESWAHRNPSRVPVPNPPSRPQGTTTTVPSSTITGKSPSSTSTTPTSATSSAAKEAEKAVTKTATRTVGKGILKGLGKAVGPASAVLDVADERSKGSGWLRSIAKGAAVAAGGALGGAAGSVAGPVGSVGGAVGGSMAASKAFDVAAGANARERAAMAQANRQRQAGGAVKGIGGKTTFSQAKPGGPAFMSTGVGKQRKTVQLDKTSVIQGPGGKQEVGHLAFKGGKAVYKRAADPSTLAKTSSNALERIGRTLFSGAYKQHDIAQKQKALAKATAASTRTGQKLGIKYKPGG